MTWSKTDTPLFSLSLRQVARLWCASCLGMATCNFQLLDHNVESLQPTMLQIKQKTKAYESVVYKEKRWWKHPVCEKYIQLKYEKKMCVFFCPVFSSSFSSSLSVSPESDSTSPAAIRRLSLVSPKHTKASGGRNPFSGFHLVDMAGRKKR